MTAAAVVLAVVAIVGVCVLSRWCSALNDDVDRLLGRQP
jgi:biopolymer transport protein ExbB/TolQ